jgi:hypothetical protein
MKQVAYAARQTEREESYMNATDIARGSTVYATDGQVVGEIQEVWANTRLHGYLPVSRYHISEYGPVRGNTELLATEEGYVQVRHGATLGYGGAEIFVPLASVRHGDEAGTVALKWTFEMAELLGSKRPEDLQRAA